MKFLTHLDLAQNELRNVILQPLAAPPENPKLGQLYYNSTEKAIYQYDGEKWVRAGNKIEAGDNGYITVDGVSLEVYKLPPATRSELGGVTVGQGLNVSGGQISLDTINWEDIENKPSIPTKTSDLTNDSDFVSDPDYVHTDKNFTEELEKKLTDVQTGAEVNVQSDWAEVDDSSDAFIQNKPTKVSQFENDSEFIDKTVDNLVNYYKKEEVDSALNAISTLDIEVVTILPEPEAASSTTIYLVARDTKWSNDDYDEYIFVKSTQKFELIGTTRVDLSNYLQKDGDSSNTTVAFTAAEARVLPISGETVATIIGKVVKYLTDLSTVAFSGDYNDLKNKPAPLSHIAIEQLTIPAGSTSATTLTTFTDSIISSVFARDGETGEAVLVDWRLDEESHIYAEIATAYANDIEINISFLKD